MAHNLAEIRNHLAQIVGKLSDVAGVHLPPVLDFIDKVQANPLVTSMEASVGGPLSVDAMAILNGLSAMTGAVRQQVTPDPAPVPPADPAPVTPAPAPIIPAYQPPADFAADSSGTVTPAGEAAA